MAAISLKAARIDAGLTQAELARRLNVSETTIWKWETGKSEPKLSQFKVICDICGRSMSEIFLPEN